MQIRVWKMKSAVTYWEESRRKSIKRMKAFRKQVAANPNSLEKILARLEAEAKENEENGFVDDPTIDYDYMYTNLRKYGNEFGVSSQHSKDLCKLKKQAIAIKQHLNTIPINSNNEKDIRSLLRSIQDVIQIVTRFYNETRDVPYHYLQRRFIPELKRGTKIIYPKAPEPGLFSKFEYRVESDEEEDNQADCKDVLTEPPTHFPLDVLDVLIHTVVLEQGIDGLFAIVLNVCHPNYIEEEIWKEFDDFHTDNLSLLPLESFACQHKVDLLMSNSVERMSIDVDHPIVSAIGKFAVKAFNKACEMHVKNGEHNNLHDFEFMECNYIKTTISYYFYMVLEAVEEGKLSIYEAKVICNGFGDEMILCQFALTDRKPFGTKAMSGKYLNCLQSICTTVEKLYLEKLTRLEALRKTLDGDEECNAVAYIGRLKRHHTEAVEALEWRLNQEETRLPKCNQMTNPDAWSYPDKDKTGMIRRATTCSGYDFYNLLKY